MPLGNDQQYDESWTEQDKVRRRAELRRRLKMENIDKRYSPFRAMQGIKFQDPAVDRYSELRKYGRMPGAPLKPKIFFTLLGLTVVPIYALMKLIDWERRDFLKGMASGEIPYEQRQLKLMV